MRREGEPKAVGALSPARSGLLRDWRWWAGPALLALALALLFADPFIGDWDGLDYTLASIDGRPSSMALGRTLFIYANHFAWRTAHALFGLRVENAYLLFKYMVVAQAPLAVLACWALAREVSDSVRAATIASLIVATSPFFVVYSGQVMTEVPSVLLLAAALTLYLRGVKRGRLWEMLLGALLLGAGVNVRETVAFYAPWLVLAPLACGWRPRKRETARVGLSLLVFAAAAAGPFLYWFLTDYGGYRSAWYGWRESMRLESALHPFTPHSFVPFLIYFFLAAPMVSVALPAAVYAEWRSRRFSYALALACAGLAATLLLLPNYSTTINWRYFLTGLPALAPLVAAYFMRTEAERFKSERRGFLAAVAGVVLVAMLLGVFLKPSRDKFIAQHAAMKDYRERLALVPDDSVMLSGSQSIAVTYWRGLGLGHWEPIGAGSGWPGERLAEYVGKSLAEGRRVFLDADPRFWPPCGWQERETRELAAIEPAFSFRRVSDTIYEVRPQRDAYAPDSPGLRNLLPENRPEEVSRCAGQARIQ